MACVDDIVDITPVDDSSTNYSCIFVIFSSNLLKVKEDYKANDDTDK